MRFNEFNFFAHVKHEEVVTTFWAWVLQCVNARSDELQSVSAAALRLLQSMHSTFATERVKVNSQFNIHTERKRVELDIVVENDRLSRGKKNQAIVIECKLNTPWTDGKQYDKFCDQLEKQSSAISTCAHLSRFDACRILLVSDFTEILEGKVPKGWSVIGIDRLLDALGSDPDHAIHPLVREHRDWLANTCHSDQGEESLQTRRGQLSLMSQLGAALGEAGDSFDIRQGLNVQGNIGTYTKAEWSRGRVTFARGVWADHLWFRMEAMDENTAILKLQEYSSKAPGKADRIIHMWNVWDAAARQVGLPPQNRYRWNKRVNEPRLAEYRIDTEAARKEVLGRVPEAWKLFLSSTS